MNKIKRSINAEGGSIMLINNKNSVLCVMCAFIVKMLCISGGTIVAMASGFYSMAK